MKVFDVTVATDPFYKAPTVISVFAESAEAASGIAVKAYNIENKLSHLDEVHPSTYVLHEATPASITKIEVVRGRVAS